MSAFSYRQNQVQKQSQKLSQRQIQAINMLSMSSRDLKAEILKALEDNPALEIIPDRKGRSDSSYNGESRTSVNSDVYQQTLESTESYGETLQQHLVSQLDMMKTSPDEYDLTKRLIYNLDKNGCYGGMLAPESLIDKNRPLQNKRMLEHCISLIQQMDPVGTCCKTPEESLFVQAKIKGDASPLVLFILDGNLELLNPPEPDKVCRKVIDFRNKWHKKSFSSALIIDDLVLTPELAEKAIEYILKLKTGPCFCTAPFLLQVEQFCHIGRVEGPLEGVGLVGLLSIVHWSQALCPRFQVEQFAHLELGLELVE